MKPWTQEEVDYLVSHYSTLTYLEIANIIKRSPRGVADKILQLGLLKKQPSLKSKTVQWTDEQIKNLKLGYEDPGFPIISFAKKNNKTVRQVRIKAFQLGLRSYTTKNNVRKVTPTVIFQNNPELIFAKREERSIFKKFNLYQRMAPKRNLSFSLSFSKFKELILSNCYYCNKLPTITLNGIDRVNNNIGYEEYNCVTCCRVCNNAKGTLKQEEFISHFLKMADYQRSLQSSDTNQQILPEKNPTSLHLQICEQVECCQHHSHELNQSDQQMQCCLQS